MNLSIVIVIVIAIFIIWMSGGVKEGYLIAPYLDLDTPGERGLPYAMS